MPRVKIAADTRRTVSVDVEVARLRDLDLQDLKTHWELVHGRKAPAHLPRHLLFRILAHRLRAERLGDLDTESQRILDRSASPEEVLKRAADVRRNSNSLRPGTTLRREWNGKIHRVAVLASGFGWNGTTYPSLSKVAFAITGTRWNGPRFFGLRDKGRSAEERP
jgi:Protein of unknown function (DUF2924)